MNDNYAQGTPTASIRVDESIKPVVVETVIVSQDSIDEIAEAVAKKLRQPERKKGHWIRGTITWHFRCSECAQSFEMDTVLGEPMWHFCPWCGADNRGDTE